MALGDEPGPAEARCDECQMSACRTTSRNVFDPGEC